MDTCCREVAEKLLLYRDGELPEDQVGFLREHLQYCPPCLHLLGGYDEVCKVLRRLEPVNIPESLCERMKQRLREEGCG
jgi:anti-sigma factor (TIGR02949 family)